MTDLRPYQDDVIAQCRELIAAGKRRILLVAPTGSGKTIIAAAIIRGAAAKGRRTLVLAHRREIIRQTSNKLSGYDIDHGIISAGLVADPSQHVQVASVQTLWARAMRADKMPMPAADLLIVDECHHCPAQTYRKILAEYPNATVIGLTATPARGDGRGLGGFFDVIVEAPQVAELIEQGFLVKTRVYAPADPDLSGIRTVAGDYNEEQLAERMDRTNLVGDIVTHWHRYGEGRKTVVFAVNVAHSLHLRNEFVNSGVAAEHIDGSTPKPDRDAALARLASGETTIITNCMVLTEGWDMPEVGCCILARPTKKMGLYRQMVGRVLRPAEGKVDAIVLDHSGAVFRHGFVEDRVEWTLSPEKRASSPKHNARLNSGWGSRLLECSQCNSMRVAGEACQYCGYLPKRPAQAVEFTDGDLALVDPSSRAAASPMAHPNERMRWHAELAAIATMRGYKPGWVGFKFKEKFGTWPALRTVAPQAPSDEVLSWVRSRTIAWAKAMEKKGQHEPV